MTTPIQLVTGMIVTTRLTLKLFAQRTCPDVHYARQALDHKTD
jgi:hypothetical protein